MFPWISSFTALVATFMAIYALRPVAIKIGLVDTPDQRKQHFGNIPLIGGIAIFIGLVFGMLTLPISLLPYRSLIAVMGILIIVGILDDFHELTPKARLLAQLFAALLICCWGGLQIKSFGNLLGTGDLLLGWFALPVSLFAVISLINAYNMIDGVDGLAGGVSLTQVFWLSMTCLWQNNHQDLYLLSLLAASLISFLFYNLPCLGRKASIFMGDAGSMLLGALMVWFAIKLTQGANPVLAPVTALWILTVPLFEIMAAVLRRLLRRKSPFKADRGHSHHRLLAYGLSQCQVSYLFIAASFLMGLVGVALEQLGISERTQFLTYIAIFIIYFIWLLCFQEDAKPG